jgi:hypothetical protein
LKRTFYTIIAVLSVLLLSPYLRYTAYHPSVNKPFEGNAWYNPYSNVQGMLLKANFHAHSKSWWGITWGENSAEELIEAYAAKDYQLPAISNYHKIADKSLYDASLVYLPVYEHGLNWRKVHCLCIGASRVSYLDYPIHFMKDHTIAVLQSLHPHCDLVAMAHPGARNAYVPSDMPSFSAMQLMEVGNTQGVLTSYWDAMLSAGQPVWVMANDDTHDLLDGEAFMRWNMIYAEYKTDEAVVSAMQKGDHYAVASYDGLCEENRLSRCEIINDTLFISTIDTFNRLDFIGQNGRHMHSDIKDSRAAYVLQPEDTYVRVEIHHDHCVMYLNPVIRYDGVNEPYRQKAVAKVNGLKTWIGRLIVVVVIVGIAMFWWIKFHRG